MEGNTKHGHDEIQKLDGHSSHSEEGLETSSENCEVLGWHGFAGEGIGIEAGDPGHGVGGHGHGLHDIQTLVQHFSHCVESLEISSNSCKTHGRQSL